jgi:uncharacterized repeat protein (TIGR03803 family)
VFELIAPGSKGGTWTEQILYTFTGGADGGGSSPLIMDAQGNLYASSGTRGDVNNSYCAGLGFTGCGLIFELSKKNGVWTETVLHTFKGPDGAEPRSPLIFDAQGNLYGTTEYGGANGGGTVFEMSPNGDGTWTENVVYHFDNPSGVGVFSPGSNLVFDSFGNLYGTATGASSNGDGGYGVIYQLQSGTWQETTLYSFSSINPPFGSTGGLAIDEAGNLYGTTSTGGSSQCLSGCGTIFKLSAGDYTYTTLFEFRDGVGGSYDPTAPPLLDAAGNLYGTALAGGGGCGAVWRLTASRSWAELGYQASHDPPGLCGPNGTPIFGKFGGLYSASTAGGPKNKQCLRGCGTVFAIYP